jgi:hypothetical protein
VDGGRRDEVPPLESVAERAAALDAKAEELRREALAQDDSAGQTAALQAALRAAEEAVALRETEQTRAPRLRPAELESWELVDARWRMRILRWLVDQPLDARRALSVLKAAHDCSGSFCAAA